MVFVFQIHPKSLKMCIYEALTEVVIAFFPFACACICLQECTSGLFTAGVYYASFWTYALWWLFCCSPAECLPLNSWYGNG